MKEVQVRVFDKQTYPTHSDEAENTFSGQLATKGEDIFITYKDQTTGVNTIVKASKNGVSVSRMGAMNGKLKFEVGQSIKHFMERLMEKWPLKYKRVKMRFIYLKKASRFTSNIKF